MIAGCLSLRDEKHPDQPKYTLSEIADIYISRTRQYLEKEVADQITANPIMLDLTQKFLAQIS
jgi:hypothetical protein